MEWNKCKYVRVCIISDEVDCDIGTTAENQFKKKARKSADKVRKQTKSSSNELDCCISKRLYERNYQSEP